MRFAILAYLIPLLSVVSCSSSSNSGSVKSDATYPVTMVHKVTGNKLVVEATLTNKSAETISLARNPNFYSISVKAKDPKKQQVYRPKIVTYGPVVSKEVVNLAPGKSMTFSSAFILRPISASVMEVEREFQPHGPRSYLIITDDTFRTTFNYEHYPRFLNEQSKKKATKFLTTPLKAKSAIRRPYVIQQPIPVPRPPAVPDTV